MNTINVKHKDPIKVRTKKLADGSESLYLDIYYEGRRKYEFLKLYLQPEVSRKVRELNKNTMVIAETIKSQRIVDLHKNRLMEENKDKQPHIPLSEWLQNFREFQKEKGIKNPGKLESVCKLILQYKKNNKNFIHKINKEWVIGFIDWLQHGYLKSNGKKLNRTTVLFYVSQLSCALNMALQMGKINENPFHRLSSSEKIKKSESTREFLTVEELKKLMTTECRYPIVKSAYIFSCYSGLRISDIRSLTYENIICNGNQNMVSITMKKTHRPIYIPLSGKAMQWLPEKTGNLNDRIFGSLPCLTTINAVLKRWCKAAGITKNITYHTSRHTFGTLMITAGVDLYVTSKLMGHSDVRTTQIYAKIIDSKKIEAVKKVDKLFGR